MTKPKENEELNEELSTDELKSVSGGFSVDASSSSTSFADTNPHRDQGHLLKSPKGSGSGLTTQDWEKWSDGTVSDGESWMT